LDEPLATHWHKEKIFMIEPKSESRIFPHENKILHGNCLEILPTLPDQVADLVFADPPYNLRLQKSLWRPNLTQVDAVDDDWDQFADLEEYDKFTRAWLEQCKRILKDTGTLWVIGTYHNIFRIGAIMQDLGFWFLNDVIWIKTNPMPHFHGVRFTNAHETLIWASKQRGNRYTFNYQALKHLNDDLQMRSDWLIPICTGPERLKDNGQKAHSTQKPEGLLYRIVLGTTNPGDVILDPFFGIGTTGAVAKQLHRKWVGIESNSDYVRLAQKRLSKIQPLPYSDEIFDVRSIKRKGPRIPFGALIEAKLLIPGQILFFQGDLQKPARIRADGSLILAFSEMPSESVYGSIHKLTRMLLATKNHPSGRPGNGWEHWYYEDKGGRLLPIDHLRQYLREVQQSITSPQEENHS
jgi:modification methylase